MTSPLSKTEWFLLISIIAISSERVFVLGGLFVVLGCLMITLGLFLLLGLRKPIGLIFYGIGFAIIMMHAANAASAGTVLVGKVTQVADGDTITVASHAVRLQGLAAPEIDEPGGIAAAQAMRDLVLGKTLRCGLSGKRSYDRFVGICYLDGYDIARTLIKRGLARDCPRYSGKRYASDERQAIENGATIAETYRLPPYC